MSRYYKYAKIGAVAVATPLAIGCTSFFYFFPEMRSDLEGVWNANMRMFRLTAACARIAWLYKTNTDMSSHDLHTKGSQILRIAFLNNGGLYIKFGQIIASLDSIVPNEYRKELRKLTTECKIDSYDQVRKIVQQEIHQPIEQMFSEFDQKPIASASIAQVHRARLASTGEEVAVKIQHAGLIESSKADMLMIRTFVSWGERLFPEFKYMWLVEEMETNLPKELNFILQAGNIKRVKEMLKDQKYFVVPKVYVPTTERLLIMEFLRGVHIHQVQEIKKMGVDSKKVAGHVSHILTTMIFKHGFVHADPHSGNILVRKKAGTKDDSEIIFLDHGLYQQLTPQVRKDYCKLWMGILTQNEQQIFEASQKLGTRNPQLFCSMLTSRKYDTLQSKNSFDRLLVKEDEMAELQELAQQYAYNINVVLNELKRQILLLFKINDFGLSLQNMHGGRGVQVYEQIMKCCMETLEIGWWERFKIYRKLASSSKQ